MGHLQSRFSASSRCRNPFSIATMYISASAATYSGRNTTVSNTLRTCSSGEPCPGTSFSACICTLPWLRDGRGRQFQLRKDNVLLNLCEYRSCAVFSTTSPGACSTCSMPAPSLDSFVCAPRLHVDGERLASSFAKFITDPPLRPGSRAKRR